LQREIIETEQNLKDLEKQAKETNTSLSGFAQAAEKIGKFGDAATSAGKKLLPVSAAITAAGGASAKMAMDFEDAMAKVNTIADTTEVPLSELEKAIIDLSNQTGISYAEVANNVYDAISSGQKTGDAVNFVSNSTKLARAGFAEAGNALDLLWPGMRFWRIRNIFCGNGRGRKRVGICWRCIGRRIIGNCRKRQWGKRIWIRILC